MPTAHRDHEKNAGGLEFVGDFHSTPRKKEKPPYPGSSLELTPGCGGLHEPYYLVAVKWPVHRNGGLVTERNLSDRSGRLKSRPPHASIR